MSNYTSTQKLLDDGCAIECNGWVYPVAWEFKRVGAGYARAPDRPEVNENGEILFVMPNGGRATERKIRGLV